MPLMPTPPLHTMSVTLHDAAYYAADDAAMIIFSSCRLLLFSRYAAAAAFDISAMLDDRYTLMPRSSRRHADGRLLMPRHCYRLFFFFRHAAYACVMMQHARYERARAELRAQRMRACCFALMRVAILRCWLFFFAGALRSNIYATLMLLLRCRLPPRRCYAIR